MAMRLVSLVLCAMILSGCTQRAAVPLIARETLFGNPERSSVTLSPDGTRLAFLAPLDGVMNIWVAPVAEPAAAEAITRDRGRGIRQFFWAYDNVHLLYLQDRDGDENWRVYSVALTDQRVQDLTPLSGVQARIEGVSHKFPQAVLVSLNDRNPQLHDLYRIDITTGQKELVLENEGFLNFVTDDDYRPRLAMRLTPEGGSQIFTREGAEWAPFAEI